ncbi:H-2 class I histocompatibility antigen, K-D alpha chain-like [Engraulis encrasicolus]|uniref:H-2 class I histocompatibility antigen, K-D alpha chain-like n=1 Tax=Engraulis encrasicolus TaxID=184585 RepID=UPI002FD65F85
MKIGVLFGTLWCLHAASAAMHSLKYFYTASSGIPSFPDFVAVGMVDEVQFIHYDGESQQPVFKQDWMKAVNADDPQYLQEETQGLQSNQQLFKANIDIVKERFNQTAGVHTLQNMYGCQWDDETQAVDGYDQWSYDGENFVTLDLKNLRYIATTQSHITSNSWNSNEGMLALYKHYFTQECIEWLKKYVQYGSSTLGRKAAPEVSFLQKGPEVACHATGFYPDSVMIAWKKNGVEMDDDVDVGETLPNEDGTFQKRSVLTISPKEKATYSCEVTHKSRAEPIVMVLEESEEGNNLPVIIGCVVAVAILVGVVVAVVMMKKKGYTKASREYLFGDFLTTSFVFRIAKVRVDSLTGKDTEI